VIFVNNILTTAATIVIMMITKLSVCIGTEESAVLCCKYVMADMLNGLNDGS